MLTIAGIALEDRDADWLIGSLEKERNLVAQTAVIRRKEKYLTTLEYRYTYQRTKDARALK